MPLILYGLLLPNLVHRVSQPLSKFSPHLLSSLMLPNSQGPPDLWFSEMSGTFLVCIIHLHKTMFTICYPWPCTHIHTHTHPNPAVLLHGPTGHKFRLRSTIHESPVNMDGDTRRKEWRALCGQCVCMMRRCAMCAEIRMEGDSQSLSTGA